MPAVSRRAPLPFATAALQPFPLTFTFTVRYAEPTDMSMSGYGYRWIVWGDGGQGPGSEAEVFRYFALWIPPAQAPLFKQGDVVSVTIEHVAP